VRRSKAGSTGEKKRRLLAEKREKAGSRAKLAGKRVANKTERGNWEIGDNQGKGALSFERVARRGKSIGKKTEEKRGGPML